MGSAKSMGRRKIKSSVWYPRARVHHLTAFMYDKNGDLIMPESRIKECLAKHDGGYLNYAYVLHDKDVYDAEAVYTYKEKNKKTFLDRYQILAEVANLEKDETSETGYVLNADLESKAREYADKQFPTVEINQLKPAHWHIIVHLSTNRASDEIARWFDLEPNWNEVKTGRGALESALNYLVHAKDPKKHAYSPEDVHASFDYVNDLEERLEKDEQHEKYRINSEDLNDILEDVALRGLSIRDAQNRSSMAVYLRNKRLFQEARAEYIRNYMPMPLWREVFYIDSEGLDEDHGRGGLGKTACAKAFAKQLSKEFGGDPSLQISDLQQHIYWAGDAKVFLQQYDGQPIVVIDEISGIDMKRALKGVNGVKSLLDPFPERKSLDKKHGDVVCTAKYIVINGIQSFSKFKKELAGETIVDGVKQESEESVEEQFSRRFWGNIKIVNSSEIEFWINRGLFENTAEREMMTLIRRVRANFKQITSISAGEAQAKIEGQVLNPIMNEVEKANMCHSKGEKITDPEKLPEELLKMGEEVIPEPMPVEEWEEYVQSKLPVYDDDDCLPFS